MLLIGCLYQWRAENDAVSSFVMVILCSACIKLSCVWLSRHSIDTSVRPAVLQENLSKDANTVCEGLLQSSLSGGNMSMREE